MLPARLNRFVALAVFLVCITIYILTLAPTVVFWDVGEFIAAAKMMQVPHPPGSPLFLLLTRIAMMIPFAADQAVRAHAVSAVLSALGIMFLYLVIVRVVVNFRGVPQTVVDRIEVYGAGVIGSLSLAFGTTYWDNSIEAEVYGASMFFLSAIMWLVMRWRERSEEEGNEKYIVLIAYLIGLSLGVHLLALLAIFPVLMIMYFRRYEYTLKSFVQFVGVSVVIFWVVYPGIVKYLPGMMDGEFGGQKSEVIAYVPWVIMALVCYGVYRTYERKQKTAQIALMSIMVIVLGYTTYTSVLIRSNANPPMNENDPNNLARLTAYLGREQYGEAPLFLPRRYSQEPQHQGIYTSYTSDMDFMVRYQLIHMFVRYVLWNYVGSEGDWQDAGVSWKETFGLPFLVGLIGLLYLFKRDWKMGLVFLAMFIILGPLLALYQNQQEPQPRERDYFYVGAFYVFSLWIGVGLVAVLDFLKHRIESRRPMQTFSLAFVALFAFAVPVNIARINWHEHDRSGNYTAWDFSYNMLQSCEQDAVLFTNGDNDTFPLWYMQDVEGVRRDVRIVNLSLVNTPWYIQEMKKKPYYPQAKPVPISLSDSQIEQIQPVLWEPRTMDLPVPPDAFKRYGVTDTALINRGKIEFQMRNTLQAGDAKAIRVQDLMVQNIVYSNRWERPIFFATTCGPDSRIGLDEYLSLYGLAYRLEPRKTTGQGGGVNADVLDANLFHEPMGFSKTPQYGFKFRNISNPSVYFDENSSRMLTNCRWAFIQLAQYYYNVAKRPERSSAVLDRMEQVIPRSKIGLGWEMTSYIASFYRRLGREDRFNEFANELEPVARKMIASGQVNMGSYDNPYSVLLEIYEGRKAYDSMLVLLEDLAVKFPNDPGIKQRIDDVLLLKNRGRSVAPAPPR